MACNVSIIRERDKRVEGRMEGTHLDFASLPSEDGCLAFEAKDIGFSLCKLCSENFCLSFNQLAIMLAVESEGMIQGPNGL